MGADSFPILVEADKRYADFTDKASTANRALALGIVAVCWLFLSDKQANAAGALHGASHHPLLAWSLALSVAALAVDALHYALGAFLWQRYQSILDLILATRERPETAKARARAWTRASNNGLVTDILNAAGANTAALKASTPDSIGEARKVIDAVMDYRRSSAAPAPAGGAPPAGGSAVSYDLIAVIEELSLPSSDIRSIRTLATVFWIKTCAALISGALLLTFFALNVL